MTSNSSKISIRISLKWSDDSCMITKTIRRFEFYFTEIDRWSIALVIWWLTGFQHSCDKGGSTLQPPVSEMPLSLDRRSTSLLLCFESNGPWCSSSWAFGASAFGVLNKPHRWSYATLILSFHFDMIRGCWGSRRRSTVDNFLRASMLDLMAHGYLFLLSPTISTVHRDYRWLLSLNSTPALLRLTRLSSFI